MVLIGIVVVHGNAHVHPWVAAAFLPPVILFLFRLLTPSKNLIPTINAIDDGLVYLNVVTFPIILVILARIRASEYFLLRTRRLQIATIMIIVCVAAVGYLAGQYNYCLPTCQNFSVTGADPPSNCRKSGHP